MPKPTNSYRHLKPEDRMTITSLMQQSYSQRDIAALLGCSASTVSRELMRNAQGKTYDSQSAQSCITLAFAAKLRAPLLLMRTRNEAVKSSKTLRCI
jgi:IS30 family transposase